MTALLKVRSRIELRVTSAQGTPGARLSAASGLVQREGRLYVIADDEHHLAVFDAAGASEGRWLRLFEGELPDKPKRRKAEKPDLETLIELPASGDLPFGALLALGSGSRPNRQTGAILPFDAQGELEEMPRLIDLRALYEPLRHELGDLNIEGGMQHAQELVLLQRANRGASRSVALHFAWGDVQPWLQGRRASAPHVRSLMDHELGALDGVPLGFTDAAALPDGGWVFSAAAEATQDSYLDGKCVGSAIGIVDASGRLQSLRRLEGTWKVEGIAATLRADDEALELTLVTDADDRDQAASCLTLSAPLRG
jgi:hypothetical protein